jgi:hypothetical protein
MALDLSRLFIGTLDYTIPFAALDDVRFERILRGFGSHYVVHPTSQSSFTFARGEGFDKFEKWDAFAYVDGGTLTRLREQIEVEADPGSNIAILPPPWSGLRLTLNVRVVLIFWALGLNAPVLWGVVMAFLSLLPAVGAAVVWLPMAAYLLISGQTTQGLVLAAFGVLVIGLVDNLLRPVLVGKDIKMPDYLVLLSTLGGISLFGLHGFVLGPVIAAMFMAAWGLLAAARRPPQ